MKELVFEAGSKSLVFKSGRKFSVLLAEAGKCPDEILLRNDFISIDSLSTFLVYLSRMVTVKEEHGLVILVDDGEDVYPFSVDLETGDVFPEF